MTGQCSPVSLNSLANQDVQLTAANDDNYFVFEDMIYQVMLAFSRDTEVRSSLSLSHSHSQVAETFSCGSANPAKAVLRGKNAAVDNMVIYPPSGVIPFHGFSMFAAPMCYVSHEPAQLYATFKALYLRFWFRLHQVSSHPQSILSLCALFENILMKHEPGK